MLCSVTGQSRCHHSICQPGHTSISLGKNLSRDSLCAAAAGKSHEASFPEKKICISLSFSGHDGSCSPMARAGSVREPFLSWDCSLCPEQQRGAWAPGRQRKVEQKHGTFSCLELENGEKKPLHQKEKNNSLGRLGDRKNICMRRMRGSIGRADTLG